MAYVVVMVLLVLLVPVAFGDVCDEQSTPPPTHATPKDDDSAHDGSAPEECGPLSDAQLDHLISKGWDVRVGDGRGVWVSVSEQRLRIVENHSVLWQVPCSTAAQGVGSRANSYKTPLGWHSIVEKIGEDAPWGQVFREKRPINRIWRRGERTDEDLVLTRVLALAGQEPGKNWGGDFDSYARCIYIHGTNDEEHIGIPASHGCIRLRNDDIIAAYDAIPQGAPVLITDNGPHASTSRDPQF